MTPEGKVKQSIKKVLDSRQGIWYFMPIPLHNRGIHDFIGVYRGMFFSIEAKAGRGRATELQKLVGQQIEEAGGRWLLVNEDSIGEVEKLLHEIDVNGG